MAKAAKKKPAKKVMAKKSMKKVKGKSGLCDEWFGRTGSKPKPTR